MAATKYPQSAPIARVGLTRQEVAEALGVSVGTVNTLIKTGRLASFTMGRSRRVSPDALAAMIAGATP